jgi:hypothetical protein
MNHAITLVAAKAVLGAGVVLGLAAAPHGTAHTDTIAGHDPYAAEAGDDNAEGIIREDESGWSCVDGGNKVCGPNNP